MNDKRMLTLGRIRALQQSANERGVFTILAIDHRDSMRQMLEPDDLMAVPASQLSDIKTAVVDTLGAFASSILLDPVYGMPQAIAAGIYPRQAGWISSLEAQGYVGNPRSRVTTLLPGWSVGKAKRLGATGIKMLLFYHPQSAAAEAQHKVVRQVLDDCARHDVPLFLEPVLYGLNEAEEKGTTVFAKDHTRLVVETARRFSEMGADILKLEFPIDVRYEPDEAAWAEACAELNRAVSVPWALLSAGEPFDLFAKQLQIACQQGCSGFMVGRALWREAVYLQGAARDGFLQTTARKRWEILDNIANIHAAPWQTRYAAESVDEQWFEAY